jgi:hypothetical protein
MGNSVSTRLLTLSSFTECIGTDGNVDIALNYQYIRLKQRKKSIEDLDALLTMCFESTEEQNFPEIKKRESK